MVLIKYFFVSQNAEILASTPVQKENKKHTAALIHARIECYWKEETKNIWFFCVTDQNLKSLKMNLLIEHNET